MPQRAVLAFMSKALLFLLLLFVPHTVAHAQAPAPQLAYDVITIKPNDSGSDDTSTAMESSSFQASNVPIKRLLENAYGIRDGLISGLSRWAESARYDINAKQVDYDPKVTQTKEQKQAMMAALLEDRFHMKVHVEVKELPLYDHRR
jgi:uncharacterized protein (TIGR03435 family)